VIGESNIGKVLFDLLFARLALESSFFDAFDRLFVVVPPIKRFLYQMAEIELAALPLPLVADLQALEPVYCKLSFSACTTDTF
jgi:hypothetical protein